MSQTKLKVIENNYNMDKENRNKALDATVSLIEKNYGKGSIMKLGSNAKIDIESISTGSLGLDIALGIGGVPKGRIVEIYGPESSGKTTLATEIVAGANQNNKSTILPCATLYTMPLPAVAPAATALRVGKRISRRRP